MNFRNRAGCDRCERSTSETGAIRKPRVHVQNQNALRRAARLMRIRRLENDATRIKSRVRRNVFCGHAEFTLAQIHDERTGRSDDAPTAVRNVRARRDGETRSRSTTVAK